MSLLSLKSDPSRDKLYMLIGVVCQVVSVILALFTSMKPFFNNPQGVYIVDEYSNRYKDSGNQPSLKFVTMKSQYKDNIYVYSSFSMDGYDAHHSSTFRAICKPQTLYKYQCIGNAEAGSDDVYPIREVMMKPWNDVTNGTLIVQQSSAAFYDYRGVLVVKFKRAYVENTDDVSVVLAAIRGASDLKAALHNYLVVRKREDFKTVTTTPVPTTTLSPDKPYVLTVI